MDRMSSEIDLAHGYTAAIRAASSATPHIGCGASAPRFSLPPAAPMSRWPVGVLDAVAAIGTSGLHFHDLLTPETTGPRQAAPGCATWWPWWVTTATGLPASTSTRSEAQMPRSRARRSRTPRPSGAQASPTVPA